MDDVFRAIEQSGISIWLRSDPSVFAFPSVLVAHALGMVIFVGTGFAVGLRILGAASGIPLAALARFLPILWLGLAIAVASGLLLLVAYPTKSLTNPVFFVKLACLALAAGSAAGLQRRLGDVATGTPVPFLRPLAILFLLLLVGTITGGWYLAYTYTRLTADFIWTL